jgi:hypothetical protein
LRLYVVVADGRRRLIGAAAVDAGEVDGGVVGELNAAQERLYALLERGLPAKPLAGLLMESARRGDDVAALLRRVEEQGEMFALWPVAAAPGASGIEPMPVVDALLLDVAGFGRPTAVSVWRGRDTEGVVCAAVCVSRRGARLSPWVRFDDDDAATRTARVLMDRINAGLSAHDASESLVTAATTAGADR